jgi:hypothetical protein
MWKKHGTARQVTRDIIRRLRVACWIAKTTDPHSEYVILSIAFPQQQWLHERTSMLRYTYIACLVKNEFDFSLLTTR